MSPWCCPCPTGRSHETPTGSLQRSVDRHVSTLGRGAIGRPSTPPRRARRTSVSVFLRRGCLPGRPSAYVILPLLLRPHHTGYSSSVPGNDVEGTLDSSRTD